MAGVRYWSHMKLYERKDVHMACRSANRMVPQRDNLLSRRQVLLVSKELKEPRFEGTQ